MCHADAAAMETQSDRASDVTPAVSENEIDLARLPKGELGWSALVAYAVATDDRIERYFLEVKSDVDLNTRGGRAKVAKFILGSANRDPAAVKGRFDGHAIMLLGVGGGEARGIPPFEAQDLARDVAKWVGVDGPRWDFERLPSAEGSGDVIAIVVDPPTGEIWTCLADGDGLADGDIYVRGDGNTRKATGPEVRAMLARRVAPQPIDVHVELSGEVIVLGVDTSRLTDWIRTRAEELRQQVRAQASRTRSAFPSLPTVTTFSRDTRSKEEFRAEVDAWEERACARPTAGVAELAGRVLPGITLRVKNQTKTFLRDVRLEFELDSNVTVVDWLDGEDLDEVDLFPDEPVDWGAKTLIPNFFPPPSATQWQQRHGVIYVDRETPPQLSLTMEALRPEQEFTTNGDDVVLVLFTDETPSTTDPVSGRWRMTVGDVNEVFEGEFALPTSYRDMRGPIADLLRGEHAAEDGSDPG